jgi:hypothetical protein
VGYSSIGIEYPTREIGCSSIPTPTHFDPFEPLFILHRKEKNMFDKDNVRELKNDIEGALGVVAAKHDITFTMGGIRYGVDTVRLTIDGTDNSTPGENIYEKDFLNYCEQYGLSKDDLGATFMSPQSGDLYKITGLKTRNRKYPILAEKVSTGKGFKFSAELVRECRGYIV